MFDDPYDGRDDIYYTNSIIGRSLTVHKLAETAPPRLACCKIVEMTKPPQ